MPVHYTPIIKYSKFLFVSKVSTGATIQHDVYRRGDGPPVVLIQELPGIGKETLRLADKFVEEGFEVILPHLFGPLERISLVGNVARVFCLRKEFSLFSANQSSPIVDWLKALCRHIRDQSNVDGVGVIGMCLTGNFAISLMGDDSVLAAVSSQPAMPFNNQSALHMSEQEIDATRRNIDATAPMKAFRFEKDWMSTAEKFKSINNAFNQDKDRIQLTTLPGKGHAVLTLDFVDEVGHPTHDALLDVISYFKQRLVLGITG